MIIGACGFGGTGSSAVKDFLKEFSSIQVLDRAEAMFAYKVDGLQDLEYHLVKQYSRHISGNIAVRRFLESTMYTKTWKLKHVFKNSKKYRKDTREFIDSLVQITYKGLENYDFETPHCFKNFTKLVIKKKISNWYEKIFHKKYTFWPLRKSYICINPANFYEKAKEYVNKILENAGADFSKIIVLDQPFEGNKPEQSFPFFDNPYAIVVDRDPRDLYIASSYQWPDGQFMPRRDPVAFVEYYKNLRKDIQDSNPNVLRIKLEEMIFEYDKTTSKIVDFLKLNPLYHVNKMKYFNPNRSIKGTQLYKKIVGHEDEIKYIEEHLSEYLFDFDKYEASKTNVELNNGFKWDKDV